MKSIRFRFMSCLMLTWLFIFSMDSMAYADMQLFYDGQMHSYTAKEVSLVVNGERLIPAMPPVLIDDTTLVPARAVFEKLGATVKWLAPKVYIMIDGNALILEINNKTSFFNGQEKKMSIAPKIINDYTMIPVRFVSEVLGFTVNWDNDTRTVSIDKIKPIEIQIEELDKDEKIILSGDTSTNVPFTSHSAIQAQSYSKVNVISVTQPENTNETFKIGTSGKISSVKYGLIAEPSRLYVDIINSACTLDKNINVFKSSIVTSIRTSQLDNSTTRVVFDLPDGQGYDVYMAEDRASVYVTFEPAVVKQVSFKKTEAEESVKIYTNAATEPNISRGTSPDRLIIDIPSSYSSMGNLSGFVEGNIASQLSTSQFETNAVRVVIYLKAEANYKLIKENDGFKFTLWQAGYGEAKYDYNLSRLMLKKTPSMTIDITAIKHIDDYMNGIYKVILPTAYLYEDATFKVNDSKLSTIQLNNINGTTQIVFNEKDIFGYEISEDLEYIYIYVKKPKEVYSKIVILDAGHGGNDPGTIANGVTEKDVNLDVSNRVLKLLEADGEIKAYATRTTDVYWTLNERAAFGNGISDLFVGMHCNSLTDTSVKGVQVFYPEPSTQRGITSELVAQVLMENVTSNSSLVEKAANQALGYQFVVLKKSTTPACLIEMGFLTNTSDASFLSTEAGRQKVAEGIYNGIKKTFEMVLITR